MDIKVNETPIRTSRNFRINNIKIDDIEIPENIEKFKNVTGSISYKYTFFITSLSFTKIYLSATDVILYNCLILLYLICTPSFSCISYTTISALRQHFFTYFSSQLSTS